MRWFSAHKDDDVIFVRRFLILPRRFDYEWRWWEVAYIKKRYYCHCWLYKRWATQEEYAHYFLYNAMKGMLITSEMLDSII